MPKSATHDAFFLDFESYFVSNFRLDFSIESLHRQFSNVKDYSMMIFFILALEAGYFDDAKGAICIAFS